MISMGTNTEEFPRKIFGAEKLRCLISRVTQKSQVVLAAQKNLISNPIK
jgi:hypothetical protein